MTLVIAGERSGVGKTTITLAILASLVRKGMAVQSFKVGPDYIDPMFHTAVTGRPCRNLDPVLTSEFYVQDCVARHLASVPHGLVEGVMGLFDGAVGDRDWASTAHIAKILKLPIILVIDCGKLSRSVAAIVHGYCTFDPELEIAGLILNHVSSDRHRALLKAALAPLNLPILGVLERHEPIEIPDRYLGLVPTQELERFEAMKESLADLGDRCMDWAQLMPLLATPDVAARSDSGAAPVNLPILGAVEGPFSRIRIAVAHDAAFNFYYEDNLDLLRAHGAELVFWSPLTESLPEQIQGLYLGGGFPELRAAQLEQNHEAREHIKTLVAQGLPTYAECGGLMYLCESLIDFQGQSYEMVGVLPTTVQMRSRLTLGYREATCHRDSPLMKTGKTIWGHEFHHSQLLMPLDPPLFELKRVSQPHRDPISEGWTISNVHASYLHLHWGDHVDIPQRFIRQCQAWSVQRGYGEESV